MSGRHSWTLWIASAIKFSRTSAGTPCILKSASARNGSLKSRARSPRSLKAVASLAKVSRELYNAQAPSNAV